HAATMVTAGVFMVCRLSPLFEYSDVALAVVTVVGASTCFFAATIGITQNDIKRVIAYSTCSQLGYMFFAAGVSAYGAAMFHLLTHAFFKALLFLGSGCVIHAMSDEQDMRKMGGLYKMVPITYAYMWIGSLSLSGIGIPGVFGMAGFYSKDTIIESAWGAHTAVGSYAFWLGVAAAALTAVYSFRLIFMTFHGKPRCDERTLAHVHEAPPIMWVPLTVLAFGAIFAGAIGYNTMVGGSMEKFWGDSILVLDTHTALVDGHHAPLGVKLLPLIVGLAGIAWAYWLYMVKTDLPDKLAKSLKPLYELSFHKWYFDELYERIFVKPAMFLGYGFWKSGDGAVIDGVGPDGVASLTQRLSKRASALQSGYVYNYAFAMIIGIVAFVTWYLYRQGAG
ncbi:MAG: NADH-quinone oxidoreductase subunit L, partial [Alphaproteobacteria bacterium]|nr:NADH-quinone oxidoreductase subunit L [Alphaproteobacteria bacterium]